MIFMAIQACLKYKMLDSCPLLARELHFVLATIRGSIHKAPDGKTQVKGKLRGTE